MCQNAMWLTDCVKGPMATMAYKGTVKHNARDGERRFKFLFIVLAEKEIEMHHNRKMFARKYIFFE